MAESRQLAAILFTDIVGYTALMGEDEHKAFELLKKNRQVQKPLIEKFGGTWIKELGDGVLAVFHSATNAVACACSIIRACKQVPGLQLRMGIHLGDTVIQNGDVFGDGVNIASRLQALAPINGIWISESVSQNISNKYGLSSHFVKEEQLKNVKTPIRIFQVDPESYDAAAFESSEQSHSSTGSASEVLRMRNPGMSSRARRRKIYASPRTILLLLSVIIVVSVAIFFYKKWDKINLARNSWIPEIQNLIAENYTQYPRAFALALKTEKLIPDDPALQQIKSRITTTLSIQTKPEGAIVYWQDQNNNSNEWILVGKTPLKGAESPRGFIRVKIEKPGYETIYNQIAWEHNFSIVLDSIGRLPENMVRVPESKAPMLIVGLEQYASEAGQGKFVQEFLMDKYEVTNKEFKKFVDAGGYQNKSYWEYPIIDYGAQIPWEKAMSIFHDETGKPGPSTWQVGTYPDGKENHPVTGISWYEAMAYAKFANKKLPTVYHWSQVANTIDTWTIIPRSNFGGHGTIPVGSIDNMSFWGVFDIAGNAREWCVNESQEKGQYFILGGGWNDPSYAFNDAYTQPAMDRSLTNGFRCMSLVPSDTCYDRLSSPMTLAHRDYSKEKPVADGVFKIYLRQYDYDHTPLNAKAEVVLDSSNVRIEKVEMDAAYNKEKLTLYLYIPKNAKPPYQTILFFPGSGDLAQRKFDFRGVFGFSTSFLFKSGRILVYPILKSCWERGDGMYSDQQDETITYKQHVIWWVQDFRRSLDYLQTRNDVAQQGFGFFGWSWGSAIGPIVCAVDTRFKAAVFHVGGLMQQKTLPEVDPFNFVTKVKIPVLMLNGKNDTFFPIETSQKPLFNLLGSGDKFKEMKTYEGGHLVPFSDLMKESITWYDKYLGAVK
ncbi:MAG: SUMF1/EgtB/PvdO family nonheme iron enzyme [Chitinophagales bacterium]